MSFEILAKNLVSDLTKMYRKLSEKYTQVKNVTSITFPIGVKPQSRMN